MKVWGVDYQAPHLSIKPMGDTGALPNLIAGNTKDIHILFYDISEDGYDGNKERVVGYFNSSDNKIKAGNSNQKLVLNLDLLYYSNIKNKEFFYSVVIHELQHMIEFYRKTLLKVKDANKKTEY